MRLARAVEILARAGRLAAAAGRAFALSKRRHATPFFSFAPRAPCTGGGAESNRMQTSFPAACAFRAAALSAGVPHAARDQSITTFCAPPLRARRQRADLVAKRLELRGHRARVRYRAIRMCEQNA